MFGKNVIRPVVKTPGFLAIESMFYTIQGEGPYSGEPALFIRLAGCNLACHFCDTSFETMADKPLPVGTHLERILREFTPKQREFVVLTGGEPLRQNTDALLVQLFASGTKLVQVETAGTVALTEAMAGWCVAERVVLVCSPKTKNVHPSVDELCYHYKYVISAADGVDPTDGLPMMSTQAHSKGEVVRLFRPFPLTGDKVWLSPCDEYDENANRANRDLVRDLCLKHGYRVNLQIHKILGVE